MVDEEERSKIFKFFNELGNLTRQRNFIVQHIETGRTIQKTTKNDHSRRQKNNKYYLTTNSDRQLLCKILFFTPLGISERVMRTALQKVNPSGVVEVEKRGGRQPW